MNKTLVSIGAPIFIFGILFWWGGGFDRNTSLMYFGISIAIFGIIFGARANFLISSLTNNKKGESAQMIDVYVCVILGS
jgi:hypothetical protein